MRPRFSFLACGTRISFLARSPLCDFGRGRHNWLGIDLTGLVLRLICEYHNTDQLCCWCFKFTVEAHHAVAPALEREQWKGQRSRLLPPSLLSVPRVCNALFYCPAFQTKIFNDCSPIWNLLTLTVYLNSSKKKKSHLNVHSIAVWSTLCIYSRSWLKTKWLNGDLNSWTNWKYEHNQMRRGQIQVYTIQFNRVRAFRIQIKHLKGRSKLRFRDWLNQKRDFLPNHLSL